MSTRLLIIPDVYTNLLTISLCRQAQKAESNRRHPILSAAILSMSCVFIVRVCVCLGRPLFLFPDGFTQSLNWRRILLRHLIDWFPRGHCNPCLLMQHENTISITITWRNNVRKCLYSYARHSLHARECLRKIDICNFGRYRRFRTVGNILKAREYHMTE